MHDVVIVGAGPVGTYLAGLLEDLDVLILEEHGKIGSPNHCSGLISTNLDNFLKPPKSCIEHKVGGADMHSPSGFTLKLRKENAAYVIDREKLDGFLASRLKCPLILNSRVTGIVYGKDYVTVRTKRKEYKARLVIGCDGANSIVRRSLGIGIKDFVTGLKIVTGEESWQDFVEMWHDKRLVRDGFLWKIPRGRRTEYGVFGKKVDFNILMDFFNIKPGMIESRNAHIIPMGLNRSHGERTLLVGDAAGQAKPWSGGGVIYGLLCARIASGVVKETFRRGDFSAGFLEGYERECKKSIGGFIRKGMLMRSLYSHSSNLCIDMIFRGLGRWKGINSLDMDFPSLLKSDKNYIN